MADAIIHSHKGAHNNLTAEYVRSILNYDPETGVFRWNVTLSRRNGAGGVAGFISKYRSGARRKIGVGGVEYMAHRLAWLFMTGEWPEFEIDHENTIGIDNRWKNLRPATSSQNLRNRGLQRNNTTGLKGTCFNKRLGKFVAGIKIYGRRKNLGSFDTAEEAHAAYCKAAHEIHGEFAKTE